MSYKYWMTTVVSNKKLTDKQVNKIFDAIIDIVGNDNYQTGGARDLTSKQFSDMYMGLNEK